MPSPALLSISYFGPVQYYSKFLLDIPIWIERHENFPKKTFRNRCEIYSPNGKLALSLPVKRPGGNHTRITDILLDYDTDWQGQHWKALEAAYNNSPFYEYYIDAFRKFFFQKHEKLWDFNLEITRVVLNELEIEKQVNFTSQFIKHRDDFDDFRESIHPKPRKQDHDRTFKPVPYKQVFDEKHGFIPNLSILDLLFNEGPNTENVLQNCLVH